MIIVIIIITIVPTRLPYSVHLQPLYQQGGPFKTPDHDRLVWYVRNREAGVTTTARRRRPLQGRPSECRPLPLSYQPGTCTVTLGPRLVFFSAAD